MLLEIVFQDIQIAIACVFFIAIAWLLAEFKGMKDELKERLGINNDTLKFRMQAYERLTLLADRISLKNLVTRTTYSNLNVVELQLVLLQTIRAEYDHNVSQQIYVSVEMWKAISNLKDQNIYIINQIAANMPNQAPAVELSKLILDYTANANADLGLIVLNALQFEAKQLF
jgi:hypothetical protein